MGDTLRSVVLFGSAARGDLGPVADIDLLVVADDLPEGITARTDLFLRLLAPLDPELDGLYSEERLVFDFSIISRTPRQAARIQPLYLDMVEDAVLLYDREGFFAAILDRLRRRLGELGARRIWIGEKEWYWDLKPGMRHGEVISLDDG